MSSLPSRAISVYDKIVDSIKQSDFLLLAALRLYLAAIFIIAGFNKLRLADPDAGFFSSLAPDPNIVNWFGNEDWGLGLPMPWLMALLAAWAEFFGGILILLGAFTRLMAVPLMVTMLVAAFSAHWQNGWFAIAPSDPSTSAAQVFAWVGVDAAEASLENSEEVGKRISAARSILREEGNPDWLFEKGPIAILNNGIEFAATYFLMCFALLIGGAGRWLSVDYWLRRAFTP